MAKYSPLVCPCGGTEFHLVESLSWKVWADDEDGKLHAKNTGNEIEEVCCNSCGKDLTDVFNELNINVNFQ